MDEQDRKHEEELELRDALLITVGFTLFCLFLAHFATHFAQAIQK